MSDCNRRPALRLPVTANLTKIVDWDHPLLKSRPETDPSVRLLAAWRTNPGYHYFFNRRQVPAVVAHLHPLDLQTGERTLTHLSNHPLTPPNTWPPVPFDNHGRPIWECHTKANMEYCCAVNRFHWLPATAAASRSDLHTNRSEIIFALLDDWIMRNPVPEDVLKERTRIWRHWYRPWAILNAGLRVRNWMLALELLWDQPGLTPARFSRYVWSIRQHMVYLARISPIIFKHAKSNHFLMEMEGLLYGSMLPWLKESPALRTAAIANITRCLTKQVLSDGVHIERSPSYHNGCIQWFAMPLILCRLNAWSIPRWTMDRVGSMLDFNLMMRAPEGWVHRFEDAWAGPDGYQSEAILSKLCGSKLPVKTARRGVLNYLRHIPHLGHVSNRSAWPHTRWFRQGGFGVARTSWRPNASMLAMKLDGFGGGHAHDDYLSFCLSWRGRTIIDEVGTRAYDDTIAAVACKLTGAHNLVIMGDRPMLAVGDPARYWEDRHPVVKIRDVFFRKQGASGACLGGRVVWPDGAWWCRKVTFTPGRHLRIHDEIYNPKSEPLVIQFHVASTNLHLRDDTLTTADDHAPNIRLSCTGTSAVCLTTTPAVIYGHGSNTPATRVAFIIPPTRTGTWETMIVDA